MSRRWDRQHKRPYYCCNKQSGIPGHRCKSHEISAWGVDALVLRLLARTLTDPEHILALADAAQTQLAAAETDAALAEASLHAHDTTLAKIAAEQDKWRTVVKTLDGVAGAESMLAEARARLATLYADREQNEAERTAALPVRARAAERVEFLRHLFTVRDSYIDFTDLTSGGVVETGKPYLEIGWPGVGTGKHGERIRTSRLPLHQAAALLGVPESEIDPPIDRGEQLT